MDDTLIETSPKDVLSKVEGADLSTWSEVKRAEFCRVFSDRVKVARYLLVKTAEILINSAKRRQFISAKHDRAIFKDLPHGRDGDLLQPFFVTWDENPNYQPGGYGPKYTETVGGRTPDSLDPIASERAKEILKNLPPLAQAVAIIDKETAKKIDRKDRLLKQGEKLREELEAVCGTIDMSEVDQTMSIGDFRKMVNERVSKRKALMEKMNEIAKEGRELEEHIAKVLFAGLPGLSEAVVDVIRSHLEQSLALDTTSRRVEEHVKFGDSEAAVEMLRHFEKDEAKVSEKVRTQFAEALEKLKVSVKKSKAAPKTKEMRA